MPILWRYLLGQYLKVFFLTVVAFIGVLLVSRLDEIAHFAAMGGAGKFVALFTAHQIPYILPIAIPISALISATLLFQGLSSSQELTAMRASGLPLRRVIAPVLIAASFLSVFNFYVISEGATNSHLAIRQLEAEVRSTNPLLFLQNRRLLHMQGAYVDVLGGFRSGEYAEDVVLALLNESQGRLNLILAEKVTANKGTLTGRNIALLSASPAPNAHYYDHLIVENIGEGDTSIDEIAKILRKDGFSLKADHLQMPLLLVKLQADRAFLQKMKERGSEEEIKKARIQVNRDYSELSRRVSLSLAVLACTLMGSAYGIEISRNRSLRGIAITVGLTALYLACFFAAKNLAGSFALSSIAFFLPLVVMITLSIRKLRRVNRGEE